ncbi:MAG: hypothetical protein ACOC32_02320 [Nanoarchaeota archaeon]
MDIVILFSGKHLDEHVTKLKKAEIIGGKNVFQRLVVIDQGGLDSSKQQFLRTIFRTRFVAKRPDQFTPSDSYSSNFVITSDALERNKNMVEGRLESAGYFFWSFEDIGEFFRRRDILAYDELG